MPDKDAVLRGISSLALIDDDYSSRGDIPKQEGHSYSETEAEAEFWATRLRSFRSDIVRVRVRGPRNGIRRVTKDFEGALGEPRNKFQEPSDLSIYTLSWREDVLRGRFPGLKFEPSSR